MQKNTKLTEARQELGLTQKQVEEGTGIPITSISHYENGRVVYNEKVQKKIYSFYLEKGFYGLREELFPNPDEIPDEELISLEELGEGELDSTFNYNPQNRELDHVFLKEETEKSLKRLDNIKCNRNGYRRHIDVLKCRFGFDGKEYTLAETGFLFGICRERVRTIEHHALMLMKHKSFSKKLREFY